jgi:chromosome segregation ATPase
MDWGALASSAVAVCALVSAGALGLNISRVATLKADLADSRARVADRDRDLAEEKRNHADAVAEADRNRIKYDARVQQLETELAYAKRLATGEDHWENLDGKLTRHHAEASGAWTRIEGTVKRIDSKTDRMVDEK